MTYFGTSDLPSQLADFGVPVVWGAISGKGLKDVVDRELLGDQAAQFTGKETMITLETERFAGLKEGETLFVEGAPHRVLQARQATTHAMSEVMLIPTPGAAPAPLRIPKGSDAKWDDALGPAPRVNGVALAAGSTLVVAVATNGGSGPSRGATAVNWGAAALTKRGERNFGVRGIVQFWTLANVSLGTADVTATIPVANAISGAIWVDEVQNAAIASFDQLWMNFGTDGNPIVTASGPTSHGNSILFACVGQEGEAGPLGTWSNGFTQGHSGVTPGGPTEWNCQINEGYRVVNSTGTYSVDDAGRLPLPWAMLLMAIKGN